MKLLLLLSLLFQAGSAHAQKKFPDPLPGLEAALQFCLQIRDDVSIGDCVTLESSANWVTKEALFICSQQSFDSDRVLCLQGIIDHYIRPEEVIVCESLTFDDEKAQCLGDIQRPYNYKTYYQINPQPGLQEAAQLCRSFFSDDDKRKCLFEMQQANLFTVAAVRYCGGLFSDDDKIQCLARLRNHLILPEEARLCGKIFSDEDKTYCLEGVRRKYRLIAH